MKNRGFSLIELLVVMGILVLLLGIILPSFSMIRTSGYTAMCSSNLHQLAYATQGFLNDNHGTFFVHGSDYSSLWINQLRPYGNLDKSRFCPMAWGRTPNVLNAPSILGSAGTATDAWTYQSSLTYWNTPDDLPLASSVGSFGVNAYIYSDTGSEPWGNPWGKFPLNGPNANIPYYCDSIWIDMAPDSSNTLSPIPFNTQYGSDNNGGMDRITIARHGNAINVAFADGHAETVLLPKLWTLNWHKGYVQPSSLPTIP